jgi:hypothetical protein
MDEFLTSGRKMIAYTTFFAILGCRKGSQKAATARLTGFDRSLNRS